MLLAKRRVIAAADTVSPVCNEIPTRRLNGLAHGTPLDVCSNRYTDVVAHCGSHLQGDLEARLDQARTWVVANGRACILYFLVRDAVMLQRMMTTHITQHRRVRGFSSELESELV